MEHGACGAIAVLYLPKDSTLSEPPKTPINPLHMNYTQDYTPTTNNHASALAESKKEPTKFLKNQG